MSTSAPAAYALHCEDLVNPMGLDETRPRLSWKVPDLGPGTRQEAYRLRSADWDSGMVHSPQSTEVPWGGPPPTPRQRVSWEVKIWTSGGRELDWSEPAWWEAGLGDGTEWQASWIGAPWKGGHRVMAPCPLLSRKFALPFHDIARARLYLSALGVYEVSLNGTKIGSHVLAPGWTNYHVRVPYQAYDITSLLRGEENGLDVLLGDGWYAGYLAFDGNRGFYGDQPWLRLQLEVQAASGASFSPASDAAWSCRQSPLLHSDMRMGEAYDARLEATDASPACPVRVRTGASPLMMGVVMPPLTTIEEIRPKAPPSVLAPHWLSKRPRYIFNLGQNMVGRVRLRVRGERGTTITLRHGERLDADGSLYTKNLRTAVSEDRYTLKGEGEEVFEPRFTFHGFQYVEVLELPHPPVEDTVTGVVAHNALERTGFFHCSDPLLNQLHENILWGMKGNFIEVPTDCPQRDERLGWTGDAQVFIRTAAFLMDVAPFFRKWLRDMRDDQTPSGAYPATIPMVFTSIGDQDGGPAWADAGVICPWVIWERYGDRRMLEEHFPSVLRFLDHLEATSRGGIRCHPEVECWKGFGDWLALDGSGKSDGLTPRELIGTAFFAHSLDLAAKMADVLERGEDAARFRRRAAEVRNAFARRFLTPDGLLVSSTQTSQVLALHFHMVPDSARPAIFAALVRDIESRGKKLATGFVGTPYLLYVLTEGGRLDLAYDLLFQKQWPSWLYSVTQGATTIWERWDGWTADRGFQDPGMNSFNHYAYGAVGQWMHEVLAGLAFDPAHPGGRRLILHPRPGGGITSAEAKLRTRHGDARVAWRLEDGRFQMDTIVPPNSEAEVILPDGSRHVVASGRHHFSTSYHAHADKAAETSSGHRP